MSRNQHPLQAGDGYVPGHSGADIAKALELDLGIRQLAAQGGDRQAGTADLVLADGLELVIANVIEAALDGRHDGRYELGDAIGRVLCGGLR